MLSDYNARGLYAIGPQYLTGWDIFARLMGPTKCRERAPSPAAAREARAMKQRRALQSAAELRLLVAIFHGKRVA